MRKLLLTVLLALPGATTANAQEGGGSGPAGARKVMPASDEAETAIKAFQVPPGFKVDLFAAEPHVANISSFDLASDGRAYVVEVFRRRGGGVLDMRNLPAWLDDDLASRTVADRIAMVRRRLPPVEQRAMELESDRVRVVEDRDGDGRADHATVFADGFNKLEDGTAAGALMFNGNVYFANIPHLWLLRDENNDGKADTRKALHSGFGVHYEISGHDLHGLRVGPDRRVYFSVGDRGLHVAGPDGSVIVSNPDSGAVLRCEPDGSRLELVHAGLRNPQDLAFDEHGNLFTGENNSDGGDASRWVYVVEGGDSGWRTGYQWHTFPVSRGPWNNERLWDVKSDIPAAYLVPPLANPDVAGPSGLTYTGGVGLPPEWRNRFLLVDFRGGPTNSGIWALQNKPKGASFELVEAKKLVWGALATDVECGYDGGVYFSDWVNGWVPMGKGRIYRISHEQGARDPAVAAAKQLLAAGLDKRSVHELARLLGDDDMRVRTAAQFEFTRRKDLQALTGVALKGPNRPARLHAIWALRTLDIPSTEASILFRPLLGDSDEEVRAQVTKMIGERLDGAAARDILAQFHDPSPRVRFFAAIAGGRLKLDCTKEAVELLRANDDRDAYVRHAAVMALTGRGNVPEMVTYANDPSAAVRLGIVLALRKLGSTDVAEFLKDGEPRVVLEAARAINDAPIDGATARLAELCARPAAVSHGKVRDLVLVRALNAAYRTGTDASAKAIAALAADNSQPDVLRVEALAMLRDWAEPGRRDRVTGGYHPLAPRDRRIAYAAVRPLLPDLIRGAPDGVRVAAAGLVEAVGLSDSGVLFDLVAGKKFSGEARAAGLRALAAQKASQLAAAIDAALADRDPALRRAAIMALSSLPDGPSRLRNIVVSGSIADQQAAVAAVAALPTVPGEPILLDALDRLIRGKVAAQVRLDIVTAAEASKSPAVGRKVLQYQRSLNPSDPLGAWRDTLSGGDATRGRKVFQERADVQCLRCHSIKGEGGNAGPDLAGIGKKQTREYLLESMLFPAKHIAQGWETVTVRVRNGESFAGVLKSEDAQQIVLIDPAQGELRVNKADVTGRRGGQTAMPSDVAQSLTKHDLRDLVEFLAGVK